MVYCIYRDEIYSLQNWLSRTQAGPGRTVKKEQEEISPNHVQRLNLISVWSILKILGWTKPIVTNYTITYLSSLILTHFESDRLQRPSPGVDLGCVPLLPGFRPDLRLRAAGVGDFVALAPADDARARVQVLQEQRRDDADVQGGTIRFLSTILGSPLTMTPEPVSLYPAYRGSLLTATGSKFGSSTIETLKLLHCFGR